MVNLILLILFYLLNDFIDYVIFYNKDKSNNYNG